MIWMRQ